MWIKNLWKKWDKKAIWEVRHGMLDALIGHRQAVQYWQIPAHCILFSETTEIWRTKNGIKDACSTADIFIHFHLPSSTFNQETNENSGSWEISGEFASFFSCSTIRNYFLFLVPVLKHKIEKRNSCSCLEAWDWKKEISWFWPNFTFVTKINICDQI